MPTTSQLFHLWESELEFKTNVTDEHGELVPPKPVPEFTGEVLGVITFDPVNEDFVIVIDPPEKL